MASVEAKRILLDPSRTFFDAVTVAKRHELSRSWRTQIAETIDALQAISALDLPEFSPEDLAQLDRLRDVSVYLLETYRKLTS